MSIEDKLECKLSVLDAFSRALKESGDDVLKMTDIFIAELDKIL